jgi:S1-C subfamily serine protease
MLSRKDLSALADAVGGLPVLGCLDGSPAAEAGARYGDILLSVNNVRTATWDEFIAARNACQGRFVARIFRDGGEIELHIELRPSTRTPMEVLGEIIGRGLASGLPEPADAAGDPRPN